MPENWETVFSNTDLYKVELIKGVLAESGIECISLNKKDSVYLFGEIEVLVPTENVFEALQIINGFFRESGEE